MIIGMEIYFIHYFLIDFFLRNIYCSFHVQTIEFFMAAGWYGF